MEIFDSRIVHFSCARHNQFGTRAGKRTMRLRFNLCSRRSQQAQRLVITPFNDWVSLISLLTGKSTEKFAPGGTTEPEISPDRGGAWYQESVRLGSIRTGNIRGETGNGIPRYGFVCDLFLELSRRCSSAKSQILECPRTPIRATLAELLVGYAPLENRSVPLP
jgi:hypothetical protein